MIVNIDLNEAESVEFASYIQAQLNKTRNPLETLDVLLRALDMAGLPIIVPGRQKNVKVKRVIKENREKLIIVLSNAQASEMNTLMDTRLEKAKTIPDTVVALLESLEVIGYKLHIPGVVEVVDNERKKESERKRNK